MVRSIVLLVGGLASLSTVSLFAQDAVLGQEYGSGVHAYFTGDAMKAYERLTAAVDHGSKDPRVFYFRGLAYLKLGRPQEAVTDFRKGAELESKDINRFFNVGRALERVQGAERLELENYRVDARMAALEQSEKLRKARYEEMKREEERVMREQGNAAPEMPAGAEVVPPPPGESENPFDVGGGAKPDKKPAAGGDKKAEENPFDDSAKPAPKAPAKKGGDLFGAVGKAIGNAAAGKKPGDAKKPATEKAPVDNSDPFGGAADEKKPAEKKPADNSDPFGGSDEKKPAEKKPAKPAEKKPDSADPFNSF
jgi:tetratricopeptide (TPR) repeat protein